MNKGLKAFNKLLGKGCSNEELDTIEKELKDYEQLKKAFDSLSKDDEKAKKELSLEIEKNRALEIISQNFKLVGNCLQAKNKYAESGWVFVKELEDEEEHNAWKEVLQ